MLDYPELPDISPYDLPAIGTPYLTRLPQIPGHSVEKFFMGSRAEEVAYEQALMGAAYEEARKLDLIMRAKSRAEERLAMAYAEGRI